MIFVEKFEDTKRFSETVSRKGQTTNEKRQNDYSNDLQSSIQKTNDRGTQTPLKCLSCQKSCCKS